MMDIQQMRSSNSVIKNCPVTTWDIANATAIFGPNQAAMRGKTVRQKPDKVETEFIPIPRDFYELHKFVTLTADVMFVNGVAFLTTLSRKIRLFTIEHVPSHTAKQLSSSLNKIVQLYAMGGLIIHAILMNMEFEKVQDELDLVQVDTTAT